MSGQYKLGEWVPDCAADAWVAPGAMLIGRVILEARASIWFNAVLRGDTEPIRIGAGSNVQDGSVLHTDPGFPVEIGEDCTIGHAAIVHGCRVGDGALIGMGATILNGADIGPGALIGANALVTEGKVIPPGALVVGAPAKVVRILSEESQQDLRATALRYQDRAEQYRGTLVHQPR